jgi:hypothetical protein
MNSEFTSTLFDRMNRWIRFTTLGQLTEDSRLVVIAQ